MKINKLTTAKYATLYVACVFLSNAACAADLSGVVSDEGEQVVMAEVILADAKTRIVVGSRLSDKHGRFNFTVPAGIYNLIISKRDYAMVSLKEISIKDDSVTQHIELTPIEFAEGGLKSSSDDCD